MLVGAAILTGVECKAAVCRLRGGIDEGLISLECESLRLLVSSSKIQ
jgi:hypothetical protein